MKKLISLLAAAILLLSAVTVSARPYEADKNSFVPDGAGAYLEGYVVGDGANQTGAKWVGFSSENPGDAEIYSFHLTTYGAAFYNNTVYGYVYGYEEDGTFHDEFYSIDLATRIPTYYDGTHSGDLVYGMAYDYTVNKMYALCDDNAPYIAEVDLQTGALTSVLQLNLGSALGVYGLAIDLDGNMYCITLSAISSKLVRVNRQNGGLTELANSGKPAYYAQCITYDCATNRIYWAEVDGPNTASNGLYSFDLSNNYAFNYHGVIGTNFELMAMYSTAAPSVPYDLPGDVNFDGLVDTVDALIVLRAAMGLVQLAPEAVWAADVNGDGSVDTVDALIILRVAMGLMSL